MFVLHVIPTTLFYLFVVNLKVSVTSEVNRIWHFEIWKTNCCKEKNFFDEAKKIYYLSRILQKRLMKML